MAEKEEEMNQELKKANEILEDKGKIIIDEKVITSIAVRAVAEIKDIGEMKGGVTEGIAGIFGGGQKGVKTELGDLPPPFSLRQKNR